MKYLLLALFFFSSLSFATEEQEYLLNSLTQLEGQKLTNAFNTKDGVTYTKLNRYNVAIHPFYTAKYRCRDMVFTNNTTSLSISACKIGGDVIFIYD